MTGSLAPLLAAQGLYFAIGAGLLPLLGAARSWSGLLARVGLAYATGVAAVGIVAAHLALAGVSLALPELSGAAAASLLLGGWRVARRGEPSTFALPRPRPGWIIPFGALVATVVFLGHAARTFAVRPLLEWDGWAIWAMKARALWEFGGADSPVFTSADYAPLHLDYPLLFPSLEATAFRVMGGFDGTLVHVQLIALAFGFAAALWGLHYGRVPGEILGLSILALMAAPPVLILLSWNEADIPLAFFVALGAAALGRWLVEDETWALAFGGLFLGAAALTKNEGLLFAVAAFVALAAALLFQGRARLVPAGVAAFAVALIVLPWQVFTSVHGLRNTDYDLGNLFDFSYLSAHSERVEPAAAELWSQIGLERWGYVVPMVFVALAAALLARRFALVAFAAVWLGLSYVGLLLVYWISELELTGHLLFSADRTVASLVIGGGALAPLLAGEALRLLRGEATAAPAGRGGSAVAASGGRPAAPPLGAAGRS